ncbi:MAG: SDR family NAD(P)-dependent oxidoreductase [Alicyclobacillaceae bacterium]|nr:SDR family NAD(P)-dependent oxidoreductase [Alicyclobacillaceae bacterium]
MKHALVTGGAGCIGSHLVDRLLAEDWRVTVVDNFYDPAVKRKNIEQHLGQADYCLVEADIRDLEGLRKQLALLEFARGWGFRRRTPFHEGLKRFAEWITAYAPQT